MPFSVIVAATRSGIIGKDHQLPWYIPQDLKRFREKTKTVASEAKFNAVIMGRKTWESLPKRPLVDRINIVLSRNHEFDPRGAFAVTGLNEALELAVSLNVETTFVIGGRQLYQEALVHPDCGSLLLTRVLGMRSGPYSYDEPEGDIVVPELNTTWLTDHGFENAGYEGPCKTEAGVNYYYANYAR